MTLKSSAMSSSSRAEERARRAAEQHGLRGLGAGVVEQLAQRRPELALVQARPRDVAREAEEPRRPRVAEEDVRDVDERLDVVHDGRLPEQADLDGERRLVARLAAVALDRLEERRLLAADVRARADAQLDVARRSRRSRAAMPLLRERVLGADVDVALVAVGGEHRDRDRLDDGAGLLLHEDAILERAGLGLVGVADEVVRPRGLRGDRAPLRGGRERGAAAAEQAGFLDRGDHALGAELAGARERGAGAGSL